MEQRVRAMLLTAAEELAELGSWWMNTGTGEAEWSDKLFDIFGLAPGSVKPGAEQFMQRIHPDDQARIQKVWDQALSDPDSLTGYGAQEDYRIVRPDGEVREIRGRGRIEPGAGGAYHWIAAEQDVTDQRMSERELLAHYHVSQALREWESVEEGVVTLLRRLGTALDYATAALWTWDDRDGALVCRAVWSAPDFDATAWEAATKALRFDSGEGLPGRSWAEQEAVCSPDVLTDPNFRRAEVAEASGITSALLFPALSDRGPVAVLAFYSRERREASERLLRTLSGIGGELGRFLERRRAQLAPSPLSVREREVLQLAAEGLTGPQIAERLVVSPSTIKTHFENIYEKLGIGDRAGAVAYALRIGLIS